MELIADKVVNWNDPSAPAGITPEKVYLGPDPFGLGGFQVAVASAAAAREPLPGIEKHEVRLVTWMAVRGTSGSGL